MTDLQETAPNELEGGIHIPRYKLPVLLVAVFVALLFLVVYATSIPPAVFSTDNMITIQSGMSAKEITLLLKEEGVIKSQYLLYAVLVLFNDTSVIKAGNYVFESPISVFKVAEYITNTKQVKEQITLVFFEGISVKKIGEISESKLAHFDTDVFQELATPFEGFLFPDTYFVTGDFTETDIFTLLQNTFEQKIKPLEDELNTHFLTKDELIILASIVEREANTEESMKTVAGILFARMDIGMALQVDAPFEYILNKPGTDLLPADLLIDSPYNTYLYNGLPPTPIGNPGLTSIKAVLNPNETEYLYYITGNDGEFHYAQTFDEHRRNIARYLK